MTTLDGSSGPLQGPVLASERGDKRQLAPAKARRQPRRRKDWSGWLFALPAAVMYAVFVLRPLASSIQYSFYDWDGITVATFVGLDNYARVFTDPQLLSSIANAFFLIIFFTVIPVSVALLVAGLIRELRSKGLGRLAQTLLFIPYLIPAAAAAIAWSWMYASTGAVNQLLSAVGLESLTRAWFGDAAWALPAVGLIGTWINLGFCTILLMSGIGKIDQSYYEAAKLDGAGFLHTFRAITLPGLRQEIGVCVTITIIAALASFDIVFMSTQGGPGYATMVPGVQVYQLGFTESRIGLASALALVLSVLVLAVILPLQRLFREK
jgi:raffinose/stachyose/melibiose transport system permease protein